MTARSVSWTDPARIAALLSQVSAERPSLAPSARSLLPAPGARLKASAPVKQAVSAPVKQAVAPPAPAVPEAPKVPVVEAPKVTAPPAPPVRTAPPKLVHTSENPADRIDMLLFWTLESYKCSGAFLADENGLTLGAHGITEAHVAIVGPLFASLAGIRSVPGIDASSGALWLGAQMMSWVEARNDRGGFCLGTVGAEALDSTSLALLKDALSDTIRGM